MIFKASDDRVFDGIVGIVIYRMWSFLPWSQSAWKANSLSFQTLYLLCFIQSFQVKIRGLAVMTIHYVFCRSLINITEYMYSAECLLFIIVAHLQSVKGPSCWQWFAETKLFIFYESLWFLAARMTVPVVGVSCDVTKGDKSLNMLN